MIEKVRTFIFAVCGAIAQVRVYANSMSDNFEKLADIMDRSIWRKWRRDLIMQDFFWQQGHMFFP
jgi:hypothetical protein